MVSAALSLPGVLWTTITRWIGGISGVDKQSASDVTYFRLNGLNDLKSRV